MSILTTLKKVLDKQELNRNAKYTLADIPDPELIPNLKEAVKLFISILKRGEKIIVVGDYDCDGISATAIIIDFMREAGYGHLVDYIVPDRFVDGYGISKNMADYSFNNGFLHMISVDNGIGAKEAVDYAYEIGVKTVIITDHHTPKEGTIPNADFIVNLKYEAGDFPFVDISGATIAWYFCAQIQKELNLPIDMRKWLDLVALTVISDVMPLQDINIAFFEAGIDMLRKGSRPWIGLILGDNVANITEADLGFRLVPMINAVGRLSHAKHAVELILSKERSFIKKKVEYLMKTNNQRKLMTDSFLERIHDEAMAQSSNGDKAIVLFDDDLHEGIVGILAGKVAEIYEKTAFVFTWNRAKQCWKGSGRTSGQINLYNLCLDAGDLAIGFGGHPGAAGVALLEVNKDAWTSIVKTSARQFDDYLFKPVKDDPYVIKVEDVTEDLYELLNSYRPYGHMFPEPEFKSQGVFSVSSSMGMSHNHWKGAFIDSESGVMIDAMYFFDKTIGSKNNKLVELTYKVVKTSFKGSDTIQIHGQNIIEL